MSRQDKRNRENLTTRAEEYFKIVFEALDGDMEKRVAFCPGGRSMLPTLRDRRDVVSLGLFTTLKKYDIALYQCADGAYSLHRVVKISPEGYIFCGDRHVDLEPPVPPERVYAKVYAIERGRWKIDCERSTAYRVYSRILVFTRPARKIARGVRRKLAAIKRRLVTKKPNPR